MEMLFDDVKEDEALEFIYLCDRYGLIEKHKWSDEMHIKGTSL